MPSVGGVGLTDPELSALSHEQTHSGAVSSRRDACGCPGG